MATTQTARPAGGSSQDLAPRRHPSTNSESAPSRRRQSQRSTELDPRPAQSQRSTRPQPRSAQPRSAQPRPAQPRSAQPRSAQPQTGGRLRSLLSEYSSDLVGLLLILTGIIVACGVYGDFAGTLGSWIRTGLGASIGFIRFFVPPALMALGISMIGFPEQVSDNTQAVKGFKIGFGSGFALVGASGLGHLLGGQPEWGDTYESFAKAGGLLGAAFASPLVAFMGSFAAGCVLAAITLFSIIVASRSSMRSFFAVAGLGLAKLGKVCLYLWRALWRAFGRLFDDEAEPAPAHQSNGVDELPLISTYITASEASRELYDYNQDEGLAFQNGCSLVDEGLVDIEDESEASAKPPAEPEPVDPESAAPESAEPEPANPELADLLSTEVDDLLSVDGEEHVRTTTTWTLPPADLLTLSDTVDLDEVRAQERGHLLEQSLAAHGVETRLVGMVVGPTVTRYELELGEGVKVSRLTSLNKDIAYAMASPDVRILAPIPGRRAIGVEVPNISRQTVLVGDILSSPEARKASHPLDMAVGRDITGRSIMMNLARMPHLLIAGATGSGKSSCVNTMLTSILMRSTPEDVRMILVDPKMVEMRQFEQVPHLLTEPVVDPKKAANALNWAVKEMDRRYELLSTAGFRDIAGYNESYAAGVFGDDQEFPSLPFILVVVDELSDLMMVAARDVEDAICRIAQKARAVGIHLIVATQRPSADVLTGVIKANIPARLAFSVSSLIDSRVILDQSGAERLVGQGDMLLLGPASSAPRRVQGAWVSESEVQKVVGYWRRQVSERGLDYATGLSTEEIVSQSAAGSTADSSEDDELLREAMEIIVNSGLGSTSLLQRKLSIGFARAGRLMDLLESKGVVGPSVGPKAREVYMTGPELAQLRAQKEDLARV